MNLVINSKFRPFTYDEMVKPLAQYKEAYDKVEQEYSNLAIQTEALKSMIDKDKDGDLYNLYNNLGTTKNVLGPPTSITN